MANQCKANCVDFGHLWTYCWDLCPDVHFDLNRNAIEMLAGTKAASYNAAGGIILALFIVYVLLFGTAWRFGASKREQLKREAVDKAI